MFTFVNREEFRYFQSVCGKFTINSTIIVEVVSTQDNLANLACIRKHSHIRTHQKCIYTLLFFTNMHSTYKIHAHTDSVLNVGLPACSRPSSYML